MLKRNVSAHERKLIAVETRALALKDIARTYKSSKAGKPIEVSSEKDSAEEDSD